MIENLYEFLAGVLYGIVGIRTLVLAARTGLLPERLLATAFLLSSASYLSYELIPESVESSLFGRLVFDGAVVALAFCMRSLFRPRSAASGGICALVVFLIGAGVSISCLTGDVEGYDLRNPGFWLEWVGMTIPYVWAGAEGVIGYLAARKRTRVGLSDPQVANQMLLWGGFGIIETAACFLVLPLYAQYTATGTWSPLWDRWVGSAEMVAIVCLWLAFFPPGWYQRWLGAEETAPEAA